MKAFKCFIGSAFGHTDVDSIYDSGIKNILSQLKISPQRVDRITHNDKIDTKIIRLIEGCHFAIVDLTYARPSVYYEAGYLEGLRKEVIYICREDHFNPKENDVYGFERVHFDLITKNIIKWKSPNASFKKELKKRISHVCKPLFIERNENDRLKLSKTEFNKLALITRLNQVEEMMRDFIERNKFKRMVGDKVRANLYSRSIHILYLDILKSFHKDSIWHFHLACRDYNYDEKRKFIGLIVSLTSISKAKIETSLHFYKPISEKVYEYGNKKIIFIDGIDSMVTLEEKLKKLVLK